MTAEVSKESKLDPKYRKIYRAMVEKGNKLEAIYKSPDAFNKIFQSETTLEREKLQRYCETLIFREPILCGKKAEEILWRRVFYEIIHIVKSNKKNLKCHSQIETMYRLHLSSAYGFYNHLILRFQSEFNSIIQLDGFLDFPCLSFEKASLTENAQENMKLLREVLTRILHKFLICLGDLSRYQIEYDPNGCTKLAFKYYQMSLILLPSNGMPLNQLGTLYGSENYGCDAAFYYLYCLSCSDPFYSARENLRLLFMKNRKRYEEITNKKYIEREKNTEYQLTELRTREIKKFLVLFLRIIDSILISSSTILSSQTDNKSVLISNHQLQELCQLCLQELNACMFYTNKSTDTNDDKLSYLSDELVFKLTMTILMTIEHLKSRRSSLTGNKTNIYFTSVAFALVFFSHIVNHTIIRLQEALLNLNRKSTSSTTEQVFEVSNQNVNSETVEQHSSCSAEDSSSSSSEDLKLSDKLAKKKHGIRLLYGLRRRKHNSDSDTNDSEDEASDDKRGFSSDSDDLESEDTQVNQEIIKKKTRKKIIAKYIERENLSETELNVISSDEDKNIHKSKMKTHDNSDAEQFELIMPKTDQENNHPVNLTTNESCQSTGNLCDFDSNKLNLNTQASLNFKEFSSQLYSCLALMQDQQTSGLQSSSSQEHSTLEGLGTASVQMRQEEFIDNEIYKLILNGNGDVEVPPGFDVNSKEAKEIEELGKKLATFEIETDTEMSIFNSSNTSSNSDLDGEEKKRFSQFKEIEDEAERNKLETESSIKNVKLQDLKNAKILINLLQTEALLPTIKVFCDWLLCNISIIQSISQVSTTVWSKLAVLLNCIPSEKQIATENICENDFLRSLILKSFETKSWNTQPVSEDIHMRSFGALKSEHSLLEFDINKLNQLNVAEENLLRLCHLRRFGYLIASLSQSQSSEGGYGFFEYDVSKGAFKALTPNDLKKDIEQNNVVDTKYNRQATKSTSYQSLTKDTRRFQLMKNMAQLRLEAEISQLESSYKNEDMSWSPYLIADTFAFCEHLKIIQDLARTSKFIIIVPLVVIDNLDSIKKDSKLARESIRWLENQFKQGNRFLRAQTHNERIMSAYDSSLKKKDLETWRFYQLVDCSKYFEDETLLANKCGSSMENRTNMITVLTACDLVDQNNKNMINIAQENGIKLVNVREFYEKWKQSGNKS